MAGTLGAFIRIRSPFPNKKALFDVGVAGPLAGFIVTLPVLFFGIAHSRLLPITAVPEGINFGEPLIFRWIGALVLGYSPDKQVMIAHPAAMAAWFGLLATSLNLFPIWQLDGGHIAYALFGRTMQKRVSRDCCNRAHFRQLCWLADPILSCVRLPDSDFGLATSPPSSAYDVR